MAPPFFAPYSAVTPLLYSLSPFVPTQRSHHAAHPFSLQRRRGCFFPARRPRREPQLLTPRSPPPLLSLCAAALPPPPAARYCQALCGSCLGDLSLFLDLFSA
ncbi:hypothetical protein NL676_008617 [Syzygium grande]|nr:hypothetical protein NL676_008617 [Syzygium grande]